MKTRCETLKYKLAKVQGQLFQLSIDKKRCEEELNKYTKRHKSMSFDGLETGDTKALCKIYSYFDKKYRVQWQGGLRCDSRGMRLVYWIDDDPEFLVLHLTSTSENICFSGSTSWLVKAPTLDDKVEVLRKIKADILKIIKGGDAE